MAREEETSGNEEIMALPHKSNDAIIDSDNRLDMLVASISDYAIYLLNPDAVQSLNKKIKITGKYHENLY